MQDALGESSSLTHKLHDVSLPPLYEAARPVDITKKLNSNPTLTLILHKDDQDLRDKRAQQPNPGYSAVSGYVM